MKILITGGSGFIGRNLIEYFSQSHEVLAPKHSELDLLNEKKVSDFFLKHNIDCVVHCAVKPGHRNAMDSSGQLFDNTRMFFNLTRNNDRFKKMIYLGSGLVYDQRYYKPKMKEDYFDKHVPEDEAGFSKYIISKYIENNPKIVELRIFGIYGKYEDYAIRFISNLICKAIFDLPLTMNQNRKFDYIYIDDLCPIIKYFINKKSKHSVYNVTPDNSIELKELAKKIKIISKKDLPIIVAKNGMGTEYSGDNSRLKREVMNLKFTKIDRSISVLYKWYCNNKNLIDRKLLLFDK